MSRFLGGRRRLLSKEASRAGYLTEIEQVWEHVCKPPMYVPDSVMRPWPILSNGDSAAEGTRWRCECGQVSEVVCPEPLSPGIRVWRVVDIGSTGEPT